MESPGFENTGAEWLTPGPITEAEIALLGLEIDNHNHRVRAADQASADELDPDDLNAALDAMLPYDPGWPTIDKP